jgi:Ni/Co efflux regulator RcnB
MKTILSALIALSVLATVAAPAGAAEFDTKKFWQEQGQRF